MPKKLTQKQAEDNIKSLYNGEYTLISKYTKSDEKITVRHSCGKEYEINRYKDLFEGKNKCPVCYPNISTKGKTRIAKVTETELKQRILNQVGTEYSYISGFTTMDKQCIFRHNTCGKNFSVAPKMFLGVKQTRCPDCANNNRGSYLRDDNYLQKLLDKAKDGKDYKWLGTYNYDNKEKIKIKHLICGEDYLVRPNDFQQGYRCPHCAEKELESKAVKEIKEILENNNIEYEIEIIFEDLIYKSNLKFDFKFNNIIIEYDGQQHFSEKLAWSETSYKRQKIRDKIKNEWIKNNNYLFIRIPYTINLNNLNFIILSIYYNTLNEKIISDFNLYVYDPNTKVIYNEITYYTNINTQYFNETNVEPS